MNVWREKVYEILWLSAFNMAEFAVTSILAANYVIALTWSQSQQLFAATSYIIEAGELLYCTVDQVHKAQGQ